MFKKQDKSFEDFEQLLKEAAQRKMTPEERREQRVSFAMGMLPMDSPITKDEMRELINKNCL